jgi:hypothetical protein
MAVWSWPASVDMPRLQLRHWGRGIQENRGGPAAASDLTELFENKTVSTRKCCLLGSDLSNPMAFNNMEVSITVKKALAAGFSIVFIEVGR